MKKKLTKRELQQIIYDKDWSKRAEARKEKSKKKSQLTKEWKLRELKGINTKVRRSSYVDLRDIETAPRSIYSVTKTSQ